MAIIEVKNLSKKYRLGATVSHDTLRDSIAHGFSSLFKGNSRDVSERPEDAGSIWALKDVSFEVKEGEVLGIIGRNGAGKSTLLKVLSRITEPTSGEAKIRGRVGSLLEVGTGFHQELTGMENIFLNGAILGMSKEEIKRKFNEIVAFAEVEKFLDTPVKRYSSGMYVRLAFAVAAHLEPEVLIVDEVLSVGDAQFQRKCLGKMEDIARGGRTVLFVSHNMGAVKGLCSGAIWLENGGIKLMGDTTSVVQQYMDFAGKGFLLENRDAHSASKGFVVEKVFLKNRKGEVTNRFSAGEDIAVEVHYTASKRIQRPFFWVYIESQYGNLFGANMVYDGLRPEFVEGSGMIACVFKGPRLLPQTYTVSLGARTQDWTTLLIPSLLNVTTFTITGDAQSLGMQGELANMYIEQAPPLIVPYEWRYADGRTAIPEWTKEGGN